MKRTILLLTGLLGLTCLNGIAPTRVNRINSSSSRLTIIKPTLSGVSNIDTVKGRITYVHPHYSSLSNNKTGLANITYLLLGYVEGPYPLVEELLSVAKGGSLDKAGNFSVEVPSKKYKKFQLVLMAASQGVNVVNKDTNDIYETIETFTPNMLNTRNGVLTANVNYTLDSSESSIAIEALTIASNIHIGYEYASTFSSEDFGTVTVNYPSQSSAEAKKAPKTNYNPITNEINVDRLVTNLGVDSYYNTIDTLLHEYGHRVQDFLNIEDNPGGSHALNENASDTFYEQNSYTLSYASRKGEKLGYAEGWATAFSLLAQSYFSSEYTTTNIPYFNDNKFYVIDYSNDNVSTAYVSTGGEASEYQVGRFLYNIVDIDKGELNDDLLNISHSKFWSLSTKNKPKTFAEFYQNCLDGGLSPNSMGILLGKFNIAPSNLANKDSSTNSPKITWTRGGGKHYQNNQFIIKFYDEKGYIKRTVNTTSCPYTLTSSDISFIKSLPGSSYYIQVAGSNSYTIDEMYYNSNVKTLSKPSIAK